MTAAAAAGLSPATGVAVKGPLAAENAAENEDARWQPLLGLPFQLTIDLPLPNFKVADFLRLGADSVVATEWQLSRDVPLRVNGILMGWGELEGSGNRLAVRLTELA